MAQQRKAPPARVTFSSLGAMMGVSGSTVSRALRDSPLVRPELREAVKAMAAKHGYRMNTAARNLRRGRTESVAVVIEMDPSTERPMSEPIVLIALGELLQAFTMAGYRLILMTRSQIEMWGDLDADGVVLLGQGANNAAAKRIREFGVPLVVWGAAPKGRSNVVFVGSDNEQGGRLAADHLLNTGRRRLLYLGDDAHPEVAARIVGARAVTTAAGCRFDQMACDFNAGAAGRLITSILKDGEAFDAVIASSDQVALGAIEALRAAGRRVPEDVAVIGYDDVAADRGLSSIHQDWEGAARLLAEKLLALIRIEKVASEVLPVHLMVRASSNTEKR